MPRKKTKHTQILCEKARKTTFRRLLDSLFKKANELSILCETEIAIIVQNPNGGDLMLWPSTGKVMNEIGKFLSIPERERVKKMVLQEKFLMGRVQEMDKRVMKIQKKNEETEMRLLMNQLIDEKTFNELDVRQLDVLYHLVDNKLKDLLSRNAELNELRGQLSTTDISHHCQSSFQITGAATARKSQNDGVLARTSITTVMEDMKEGKYYSGSMSGTQNNLTSSKDTDTEPKPTEATSSILEGNQIELLDDLNQVWPAIFSP